ncbi:MAG: hypothetical protein LBD31_00890 [Treponema sp.]|nr:hypothetical protein [Treponema sp.]
MGEYKNWMPGVRTDQLAMSKEWMQLLGPGGKAAAWNVPVDTLTALGSAWSAAQGALDTAVNETTRTPVATARCREAFAALTEIMRDIKRRYFLDPPLTEADYISLGLKPRDTISTPSGVPTAQVTVETYLAGRHEMGVKIVYVTGNPGESANKGYRVWYALIAPGEEEPGNPEKLTKSFYTKRKKDLIEFDFEDSGKRAFLAVQVENDGKKGPWGPMVSAVIP